MEEGLSLTKVPRATILMLGMVSALSGRPTKM